MSAFLRATSIEQIAAVRHVLTTRSHGSVGPSDDPAAQSARDRAVTALSGEPARLVVPHQVHGNAVAVVGDDDAGRGRPGREAVAATDGLVTRTARLPLFVQGADCPLVLVADATGAALAVVHSGWRGTVAAISDAAVRELIAAGAEREQLRAAIFPGIGPCCFEVGQDVVEEFAGTYGPRSAAWFTSGSRPGHPHLDLASAIESTLRSAGVTAVERVEGCTACGGTLWSHRASGGAPERHALVAMLV